MKRIHTNQAQIQFQLHRLQSACSKCSSRSSIQPWRRDLSKSALHHSLLTKISPTSSNQVQEACRYDQEDLEFSSVAAATLVLADSLCCAFTTLIYSPINEVSNDDACQKTADHGQRERCSWKSKTNSTDKHYRLKTLTENRNEREKKHGVPLAPEFEAASIAQSLSGVVFL